MRSRNSDGLDDILNMSINGSGYTENYGVLGLNRVSEEKG